ncbi:MAG: glycosyltransferase family 9 protein [Bacteroidales bacterium]|nr:glycosyltransferase family 9 protein [Bacteroidales bacterium]MDD4216699.1 glycosyltransferase family 9 protein [Bacteroidales bacterium]MDY0141117.1 glycosyltransferase family 9 protein [Bacteroidales bacterium]
MDIKLVKYDCKHFKGAIPCKPNKTHGVDCENCSYYQRISKRILIIKLGAMGDVIRTTPLVIKYKQLYPDCHISWLTLSPDVLPKEDIDCIYKWNETSLYILRNKKFDITINLDKEEEACMLLAEVDSTEKFGFIWNNNHIDAATKAAEHKLITGYFDHHSQANTQHYLDEIFQICHLKFNDEPYLLNYNQKLSELWKEKMLKQSSGKLIIGLNTGCGNRWLTRLWSDEMWIELINLLLKAGFFPVILGGPQEDEKNTMLANKTGAWYPGTYSLEEFFAITSALDIIVTQVSMMMHIATALQKKIVLMNNIFNKHEFYLYNRGVIVEPENGCDCFYGNSCKRETSCMYDLKPTTVFDEVLKLSKV